MSSMSAARSDGTANDDATRSALVSSLVQPHRPARGGGPLDRVDQLVALDGEVEVDVEGPAAAQGVGRARVGLGDVVGLAARSALRSELVLGRDGHRNHGLLARARMHLARSKAERAIRPDDQGALTTVDLHSIAAGFEGKAAAL